ncbi:hypothetical protein ABIA32_003043 [Streptacidiphilus sp. MAP12-20]|uniref:AAA family ATPase n=1 Tax=Streptacidiphilus sp. MAP12-20 TaxID=3156299 RepID=UPI00351876FF
MRQESQEQLHRRRAGAAVLFMVSGASTATVVQMLAQTSVRPGTWQFWLLVGSGALLTALVSVLGLYPVKTRTGPEHAQPSGTTVATVVPAHNLPPRSAYFTGRDHELARLEALLSAPVGRRLAQPRVCVVHGLGGIGKSSLARAYAEQQRDSVRLVRWLNASRPNTLRGELLEFAACVGIPYDESHTVMISRLWVWLREQPSWLFVYDDWGGDDLPVGMNGGGARTLNELLPPEGHGQVLVTTQRREEWSALDYGELALAPLAPEDGLRFLSARTQVEPADLRELGDQLGWMPIELERAGAHLEQTGMAPKDYLDSLESLPARSARSDGTNGSTGAARGTFQMALNHVVETVPASLDLLRLASFLASEDVPRSTLYRYRALLPDRLRQVMGDQPAFNEMVLLLVRHSLLQRAGDGRPRPSLTPCTGPYSAASVRTSTR